MKIKFCGAARTVTGTCHLIELSDGYKILFDCGLFQGHQAYIDEWNSSFPFNPAEINTLILSHAHIDHCGRLPKLVKEGFKGTIWCTSATKDLVKIMLADTAHIQESDAEWHNKNRTKKGEKALPPLYTVKDVPPVLALLKEVDYESEIKIRDGVTFRFRDAGHILGSTSFVLKVTEGGKETRIGFSGDIGRPDRPILKDPERMEDMDYLICESTYGNRIHEGLPDDKEKLLKIITDTCVVRKGKVVIPAFSLGRTQEIVYLFDQLFTEKRLPKIKFYVDSPLSANATEIYRAHDECFDDDICKYLQTTADPFGFNDLTYIADVNASKALNTNPEPCIIISASGMAEAGRVVHHIKNTIESANNTILIVGYCAEGSLGARLRVKPDHVKVLGMPMKVRADIEVMDSFSAHADKNEILKFLDPLDRQRIRTTFLVHGDYEDSQIPLQKTLSDINFKNVMIPEFASEVVL